MTQFKHLKPLAEPKVDFSHGDICIHGVYGSGKTHIIGDAIRTERQHGVVMFANIKGEDGHSTAAEEIMALGELERFDVDRYEAADELADYAKEKDCHLLAVDSLSLLYSLCSLRVTKTERVPAMTKEVNEWTKIHFEMNRLMAKLRRCCHYLLVVCPSQRSIDQVKEGEDGIKTATKDYMICPDLNGKYATACQGWFDFLGYLKKDLRGKQTVRELHFEHSTRWLTRQRGPKSEIVEPIVIPESAGSWSLMLEAIKGCY